MKNIIVSGSDIELNVDPVTGEVVSFTGENPYNINKIDVAEYLSYYDLDAMPSNVDILTVGYWYNDNQYAAAESDYRLEIRVLYVHKFTPGIYELKRGSEGVKTVYVLDENLQRIPLGKESAVDGSKLYKTAIIRTANLANYYEPVKSK